MSANAMGFGPASERAIRIRDLSEKRNEIRERLRVDKAEIRYLQQRGELQALKESTAMWGNSWVEPWARLLADLESERDWLPITSPSSRKRGDMWPMFRNETDLQLMRDLSRILATTNNHAAGLIGGVGSFVVGEGMQHQVTADKRSGGSKEDAAIVEAFLDQWSEDDMWPEGQQESFERSRVDGETFVRVFPDYDCERPTIRYIWPEQVTKPPSASEAEFGYGVMTARGDIAKPTAYWLADVGDEAHGEAVPAYEVEHIKVNVWTGIKRGIPDLAFGTKDALHEAGRLTKNLGSGAAAREAVAWVHEHSTGTQTQVEGWANASADRTRTNPRARDGRTINVTVDEPATVYNVPASQKLVAMAGPAGGDVHIRIVQLLLRSAGVKWNAPEWLTSGDASNMGAYTSSLVAESPFVRRVKRAQAFYRRRFLRIIRMVLLCAEDMGILPAGISKKVKIELTAPTAEVRNKLEDANVDQIYYGMGVKSPQRMSREQGWDYSKDAAEINAHIDSMSSYNLPLPLPAGKGFDITKTTEPTAGGTIPAGAGPAIGG